MKTKVGPAKSTEEIKDFRHCDLELGGVGVDQAVVYLFRVDYQAKELVEASRTYTDRQGGFEMLTPTGLEVQIFVDPKEAKNVPAELKGKIRGDEQRKGNVL